MEQFEKMEGDLPSVQASIVNEGCSLHRILPINSLFIILFFVLIVILRDERKEGVRYRESIP